MGRHVLFELRLASVKILSVLLDLLPGHLVHINERIILRHLLQIQVGFVGTHDPNGSRLSLLHVLASQICHGLIVDLLGADILSCTLHHGSVRCCEKNMPDEESQKWAAFGELLNVGKVVNAPSRCLLCQDSILLFDDGIALTSELLLFIFQERPNRPHLGDEGLVDRLEHQILSTNSRAGLLGYPQDV